MNTLPAVIEKPIEQVVIQRHGALNSTLVIKVPPTVAEHNVIVEALKGIRHAYPGAWFCAQMWERATFANKSTQTVGAVKRVTAEHLGLPSMGTSLDNSGDDFGDVPFNSQLG